MRATLSVLSLLVALGAAACGPQAIMLADSAAEITRGIGNPLRTFIFWRNVADAENAFLTALEEAMGNCKPSNEDQKPLVLSTSSGRFFVGIQATRNCSAYAVFTNMTIRDAGAVASTVDISDLRTPATKMLYPDQLHNAVTALRSRRESRPGVVFLMLLSIFGIE